MTQKPRELYVPRFATILALLIVTAAIVSLTIWSSGKSYSKVDALPFEDLRHLLRRASHKPVSTEIVAVVIVPIIGNILLFMPWGFLTFITFYRVGRATMQTYILTILLGFTFSVAIEAWQYFLPTRVSSINDIIWNTIGTIAGAILGHMRLRVRFEFE